MDRVQQAEKRIMQSIAAKQDEESKRLKLTDGIPLDRLAEICAAEKDGRCVVLEPEQIKLISNTFQDVGENYNCGYEYVKNCVINASHMLEAANVRKEEKLETLGCDKCAFAKLCGDADKPKWPNFECNYFIEGDLSHLFELLVAERDGRCVVLPCKVGDTVYVHKWAQKTDADGTVWDILDRKRATVSEKPFTLAMFFISKLGEGYWLTRESAEAALKGGPK